MRSGGANYRDEARVEHMLFAANRIASHKEGLSRNDLREGDDKTEVIIYNIQVIGEAANNISDDYCKAHPEVDFYGWSGIRHRLVHDYANIDFDIIWSAIVNDLPKLIEALKPIVDAMPEIPELPSNIDEF